MIQSRLLRNFQLLCIGKTRFGYCTKSGSGINNVENQIMEALSQNSDIISTHDKREVHTPVMLNEVLEMLNPQPNEVFIDMTFGGGGHSKAILNKANGICLAALDRDPDAFKLAEEMAKSYSNLTPMLGKFSELPSLLKNAGIEKGTVSGILIDAGCSSVQFDVPQRGFSVSANGPLDMRMDKNRFPKSVTAADVVNSLEADELAKIFKCYGEERYSKKIAQAIIDSRFMLKTLNTTHELASLVETILNKETRLDMIERKTHPATKIFQALRIFVNNELNELNYAMEVAYNYLRQNGRLVVLTFHSLEDRIVKRHILGIDLDEQVSSSLSQKYKNCDKWHDQIEIDKVIVKRWEPINKNILTPTKEEVERNPRSRSAKLRVAVKV